MIILKKLNANNQQTPTKVKYLTQKQNNIKGKDNIIIKLQP